MKHAIVKPCRICGNPVTPRRRQDRQAFYYPRQCQDCYKRFRNPNAHKQHISDACRGEKHPRAKPLGTRRLHKVRDGVLYWLIKVAPTGKWPYEHRVVMEHKLGRPLLPTEDVHHLDHDTLNNDPENLVLISHGAHLSLHHTLPQNQWTAQFNACQDCGTTTRKHAGHGRCTRCYQRKF